MKRKYYIVPETEVILVPYRVMKDTLSAPQGSSEEGGSTDWNWARRSTGFWDDVDDDFTDNDPAPQAPNLWK